MLDELLGRADLKAEIDDLEDELDDLQAQLSAETSRRREAVRARQEAEELVNQREDRIAGLEGELEQLRDDEETTSFQWVGMLSIESTQRVFDRLESVTAEPDGAFTAGVSDEIPEAASELLDDRVSLVDRAAPCVLCADDQKVVRVLLSPPVQPADFTTWEDRFALEREWFFPTGEFDFALVRADLFAMGTYRGRERLEIEGFESDVMGRHSKGGFSQARFERRRDEQLAAHRDRVNERLANRHNEKLIVVGDRRAITELDVDAIATAPVDSSGDPAKALDDAFRSFWRTRVYIP